MELLLSFLKSVLLPTLRIGIIFLLLNLLLIIYLHYNEGVVCELEYTDVKNRTQYVLDTKIDGDTRIQTFHGPLYEQGTYISKIICAK